VRRNMLESANAGGVGAVELQLEQPGAFQVDLTGFAVLIVADASAAELFAQGVAREMEAHGLTAYGKVMVGGAPELLVSIAPALRCVVVRRAVQTLKARPATCSSASAPLTDQLCLRLLMGLVQVLSPPS